MPQIKKASNAGVPVMAARQFPGVYMLPSFNNSNIFHYFDTIIREFNATVDRAQLHEQEFGIATYREAMDAVMGKRILAS